MDEVIALRGSNFTTVKVRVNGDPMGIARVIHMWILWEMYDMYGNGDFLLIWLMFHHLNYKSFDL